MHTSINEILRNKQHVTAHFDEELDKNDGKKDTGKKPLARLRRPVAK